MLKRILPSCAFLLFASAFAVAQLTPLQTAPTQTPNGNDAAQTEAQQKAQREKEEREQKAFALLDEVITQGNALRRTENRVRVQATAASLLWSHDEKRARELYRAALSALAEQMSAIDLANQNYQQRLQPLVQSRAELLQTLASHDAKLALELLRSTRPPDWSPKANNQYDTEAQTENNILQQIATQDPQQAAKIAEEMLKKGVSYQIINLLSQLQSKDAETATKVFNLTLSKLRTTNFANQPEALPVAINLAQTGVSLNNSANNQSSGNNSAPPYITAQNTRELIEVIAAANVPANNYGYLSQLQPMMDQIEKFSPASATVLRRRLAETQPQQDPSSRMWNDFNNLLNGGNLDAAVNYIVKAPSNMRDNMYQNVAYHYFNKGETERARQIIDEHVQSPAERARMLSNFEQQLAQRKVQEGKISEAQTFLSTLHSDEERAVALVQFAYQAASKNKPAALEMLDEAFNLISGQPRNAAQMNAQFMLSQAYAQFGSPRGFELLEPMPDQLNELLAAEAVIANFSNNEQMSNDEFPLQMNYGVSLSLYTSYTQHLASLARLDFDRAKAIADRFQRPELQTMARLFIVQSILQNNNINRRYNGRRSGVTISSGRGIDE